MIIVSNLGKIFIRNICMGFDKYLVNNTGGNQYSRTI